MNGQSQAPKEERVRQLQSLMPEVFDEGKIDWEKLKATLGDDINFSDERYRLNWAGKGDAFRTMQKPSYSTLVPCREESIDFDNTQNIFIEGENMEVLKVLQKAYFGKVKMIYIDPPYNTGNDSFIYPDRFSESKKEYLRRVGDKDSEGYLLRDGVFHRNSKENGQYHSNWLNMMMPRLYLAKSLLRDDGVIFISIDDNEVHNLRLLMNEIFGEENFIAQIAWRRTDNQPNIGYFAKVKEYILLYSKSPDFKLGRLPLSDKAKAEYRYSDAKGLFRRSILLHRTRGRKFYPKITKLGNTLTGPWMVTEEEFDRMDANGEIYWTENGDGQPYGKTYLADIQGQIPNDFWGIEFGTNQRGSLEVEKLFNHRYFDFPKPVSLLYNVLMIGTEKDSLILDFFAGSGTTAHAVMQLNKEDGGNRKYILVQLPEPCKEDSEAYKAGFRTIADIAKERIRRAGAKIRAEVEKEQGKMLDLGFKVFKLADSNFKQWRDIKASDKQEWQQQTFEFVNPIADNATLDNTVYELLLKNGYDLNSTVECKDGYYAVNGHELALILEKVTETAIDAVIAAKPQKVIALDRVFEGNDQLKTNTALQMRDAGVIFETI